MTKSSFKRYAWSLMLLPLLGIADENFDDLLASYKSNAEFSRINKVEAAGFVTVFSRDTLEKMQARTLGDVFKVMNIPFVFRDQLGINSFKKPSQLFMPNCAVRVFINGHNLSTGSSNSAMAFSNLSLEYIDHIVLYTSASSIEFGNEPGTIIIKLFTKDPKVEEGGKVKLNMDDYGSVGLNGYIAQTFDEELSYMFFANGESLQREEYSNKGSTINSDEKDLNIYSSIIAPKWRVELSLNQRNAAPFLGTGVEHTPQDNENALKTQQSYIHYTKELDNDVKIQLSYDLLYSTEDITDFNGIFVGDLGLVTHSYTDTTDIVFSAIVDKTFYFESNKLYVGSFYKHKASKLEGLYDGRSVDYSSALNLYSLYAENIYKFTPDTLLVTSLKYDYYDYTQKKNEDEYIARIGFIKNIGPWQFKAFFTDTYYQTPYTFFYSDDVNAPFKTNNELKNTRLKLSSIGFYYKTQKQKLQFNLSHIKVKDKILFLPAQGYINSSKTAYYTQYELIYSYNFNRENHFKVSYYGGTNNQDISYSPANGVSLQVFNHYGKFDFYNELLYKESYTLYNIPVDASYNFTSAVKYNYSDSLSYSLKAENIFDKSYQQVYQGVDTPIPVFDRKVWFGVEYQF